MIFITVIAFLPFIVCLDAAIAPDLTSMNKTFTLKFWAYLSHTCNVQIYTRNRKDLKCVVTAVCILTFQRKYIKMRYFLKYDICEHNFNTCIIYPGGHVHFLFYFSMNASVPGQMFSLSYHAISTFYLSWPCYVTIKPHWELLSLHEQSYKK